MRLGARQFKGSKPDIESVVRELRASLAIVDSIEAFVGGGTLLNLWKIKKLLVRCPAIEMLDRIEAKRARRASQSPA